MFGNHFRFLVFKGNRKKIKNKKNNKTKQNKFFFFFLFSKWKTRLVSWKEKHIFQKQNSGNLFGSCFWKGWILFSLVIYLLRE